ncbi:MAG: hypothetical protein IT422_13635 [Pirellulaceae bacterium]|nr:hypothetical protein [Pirellulaceae bacterium]
MAITLIVTWLPISSRAEDPLPSAVRQIQGPLRVHPINGRYFTDDSGRVIYLAGSQTGGSDMQEDAWPGWQAPGVRVPSDFPRCLEILSQHNHNLFRMWTVESSRCDKGTPGILATPLAYLRTGPGNALDGQPKFDLDQFNPAFFDRLHARVSAAQERGIYVIFMLFEGFSSVHPVGYNMLNPGANPWFGHPFNQQNNVNGVNGDLNDDGWGLEFHTLAVPAVTALQKAYVKKVIDTLNDLDNVIYEIANESIAESQDWQYELIDFIKGYEATKPKQHPVLMSMSWPNQRNSVLFASSADAVAPGKMEGEDYESDPPAAQGQRVVIADFDHINYETRDPKVVWKNFLRGNNPVIYDFYLVPFDWYTGKVVPDDGSYEPLRGAVGHTRTYANKMDLAAMTPQGGLSTTGYCLASTGHEYLVYLPDGGEVTVDLTATQGALAVEWMHPVEGTITVGEPTVGGGKQQFKAPFTGDAVLYIVVSSE